MARRRLRLVRRRYCCSQAVVVQSHRRILYPPNKRATLQLVLACRDHPAVAPAILAPGSSGAIRMHALSWRTKLKRIQAAQPPMPLAYSGQPREGVYWVRYQPSETRCFRDILRMRSVRSWTRRDHPCRDPAHQQEDFSADQMTWPRQ